MIYTLSFNPAIDYVVFLNHFNVGQLNRTVRESSFIGGKGINVSLVLKELGFTSTAMGFLAGFTGKAIESELCSLGIKTDFVWLPQGNTRINVKIKTESETEINGQGPEIDAASLDVLRGKLTKLVKGDYLILAGSVPSSLPQDIYEQILGGLAEKEICVIVDATKDLLKKVLHFRPFLIKPNRSELGELFGEEPNTDEKVAQFAANLKEMGAQNVLVSLGGDGALLLDSENRQHHIQAVQGKAVNTVGAGDSMVAGFLAGYLQTEDFGYALKLGTSAGAATAFSEGLAKECDIREIFVKL